jgi:hypothetical protein
VLRPTSDLVERVLLRDDLLQKLHPSEPSDRDLFRRLQAADDAQLLGGNAVAPGGNAGLVRGALYYAVDALSEAHALFQEANNDLGAYWHGMLHRREGDFDNARYWHRRAGVLPAFATMHRAASEVSGDMARQDNWDPYLFTGQCEQARHGAPELVDELLRLQRIEFEVLFDYTWRQTVAA